MLARRLLAAVAALALAARVAEAVVTSFPTTWSSSSPSTSLGVAGSPSARTLFISYYSNWQYNLSSSAYPAISNSNYNMIRASPALRCRPTVLVCGVAELRRAGAA
jgi:hypothetical protein